jgi:tRNA (adenine57-N1/adenine58-N1)-methyltransferase
MVSGSSFVVEGERVLLLSDSGEKLLVVAKRTMHKVRGLGAVDMASFIGKEWGSTVDLGGQAWFLVRPSIRDAIETMERGAQIITPKDAALIAMYCDVRSGSMVLEAGTGSGALTMVLAGLVAPSGKVVSYDNRKEHQAVAARNLERSGLGGCVELKGGDVTGPIPERGMDAVVLDIMEPWKAVGTARECLRASGHLASYSPTANQVEMTVRALRDRGFREVVSLELMLRNMVVGEGGIRPSFDMLGHTGYLTFARRL